MIEIVYCASMFIHTEQYLLHTYIVIIRGMLEAPKAPKAPPGYEPKPGLSGIQDGC